MLPDGLLIQNEIINGSEAGISARLHQAAYEPVAKEKNSTADTKPTGPAAFVLEMLDEQLYGKAYSPKLPSGNKVNETVAAAEVPSSFSSASFVGGKDGHIDFAAVDEVAQKRNTNADKLLTFVDSRVGAKKEVA